MANDSSNSEGKMTTATDNLAHAKHLAATVGVTQFWCLQAEDGQHYVVSDAYAQRGSGRRFYLTDDDAIALARKAGVDCDDDGRVR
jgi:hypothetical protein